MFDWVLNTSLQMLSVLCLPRTSQCHHFVKYGTVQLTTQQKCENNILEGCFTVMIKTNMKNLVYGYCLDAILSSYNADYIKKMREQHTLKKLFCTYTNFINWDQLKKDDFLYHTYLVK